MAELNKKEDATKKVDEKKDPKSTASPSKVADSAPKAAKGATVVNKAGAAAATNSRLADMFWVLGSLTAIGIAIVIFLNKIPKQLVSFQSFYSYFYVFAIAGVLGFLGEKLSITVLGIFLPVIMAGVTILIKLKPNQYSIEAWWNEYSVMVLFAAGFIGFLFYKFDNLRKNAGSLADTTGKVTGADGNLKTRVDTTLAAKYKAEMDAKNKKNSSAFDAALGLKGSDEKKDPNSKDQAGAKSEKKEDNKPIETNEERMEREVKQMREDFNKRSMRLTTTLMRIKNLTKSLDRDQIFSNTVEIITKGLDAKKVQLLLNDEKEGKLRIVKATGMKVSEYKNYEVPYEENSMITHLLNVKINEVTGGAGAFGVKECEIDPQMKGLIGKGVLSTILAAPIYSEEKLFAIINVEEMNNPDYTRDDQNLLTTCAEVAGLVMKNAKLYSATMDDLVSAQKLSEDQLKQNEQLRGSLNRIVSPAVAEMIMSDPSALKLGGKKCEVSCFFSDIRGFTKMSENMDPTDIVEQLNVYFTRMTDILMELDGTLDKYVGDELMALFGAPVARDDDPIRAVLCGVRMLDALRELQEVWKKEGKPVIQIGVGVNTGIVTAGYMGSEKALSYTVIGDNVNLAARIMAQAKGMEMYITRATYERVKDYFDIEQRESIMVKGKSMPIEIFCVLRVKNGVDMSKVIGKDVGHLATSLVQEKPKESASSANKPMTIPPGMKEEDMKQNVQIEEVKMIACSNCGQENPPQEKFCTKCGMPIF